MYCDALSPQDLAANGGPSWLVSSSPPLIPFVSSVRVPSAAVPTPQRRGSLPSLDCPLAWARAQHAQWNQACTETKIFSVDRQEQRQDRVNPLRLISHGII